MRPVRHSLIKSRRKEVPNPYAEASGCSTQARSVKAQIYAAGKSPDADAGRTASAPALPERTGVEAEQARLVPHFAHVSEASEAPINNMGKNLDGAEPEYWESVCEEDFGEVELVLTGKGETKTLLVRRPTSAQCCVIDWLNFTVSEDTWSRTAVRAIETLAKYERGGGPR
jgi:phage replication initiation protein